MDLLINCSGDKCSKGNGGDVRTILNKGRLATVAFLRPWGQPGGSTVGAEGNGRGGQGGRPGGGGSERGLRLKHEHEGDGARGGAGARRACGPRGGSWTDSSEAGKS